MKMHNIVIIVLGVFFVGLLWFNWNNQKAVSYNRTNIEYANKLASACYDAAQTIDAENMGNEKGVWSSLPKRLYTLEIFYKSLAKNVDRDNDVQAVSMPEYTPFVILVDTNGFYISYNACFDEYGNGIVPDDMDQLNSISNLNTWVENYGNTTVRYYLNDFVDVTLADGTFYTGLRENVYQELPDAAKAKLPFLASKESYGEYRINVVARTMEDVMNYYLNTQIINHSEYNTGYDITLPETIGEDWSRMLLHPTVISFMQGDQKYVDGRVLNIYAYAAGELNTRYRYFIINGEYYCIDKDMAEQIEYSTDEKGIVSAYYKGTQIDGFYNSMEECAKYGAVPSLQAFGE